MTLILLLAFVACAALLPLVLPLLRRSRSVPERGQYDRVVYRDQLRELDRDVARGLLTETESASARLEIQRRLLAVESAFGQVVAGRNVRSPVLASIVAVFTVGGAVSVYAVMGAPGIPDSPFASHAAVAAESAPTATEPPGHNDLSGALGKLAAKLKANPSDADGWELYARTAGSMRHWDEAVDGYRHALALGRNGAEIQAGYGETLVLQADGIVTPGARDAFAASLKADPKEDVAQYYMALAAGQAGQPKEAIERFQALLADIPSDSPMREEIGKRVTEAAKAEGVAVPVLAKGTPPEAQDADTDADAAAASAGMMDADQKKLVEGMVTKLATRLQTEPGDTDGWMRLGRAYVVMGERDKAADAYDRAVAQKPGDAAIRLQAVEGLLTGLKPDADLPPRAVALLRQVEAISPDESAVLWYLGVNAAREAHPADAKRYWTRLLAKLPADGEDTKMVKNAMASLKGG